MTSFAEPESVPGPRWPRHAALPFRVSKTAEDANEFRRRPCAYIPTEIPTGHAARPGNSLPVIGIDIGVSSDPALQHQTNGSYVPSQERGPQT